MPTSAVPAAVDALVDILDASEDLANAQVLDGPPTNDLTTEDVVFIGWQPGAETAVVLTQSFNAAGARTRDEAFDIAGYIESRAGDQSMRLRRARAYELLAAVETALRATTAAPTRPTLNGTVLWAELTAGNFVQAQTQDGPVAGIAFTVSCRARI